MELQGTEHTRDPSPERPSAAVAPVVELLRRLVVSERLGRYSHGLLATGLLDDLRTEGPYTLLAPVDEAFDSLPFAFDELLYDDRLVEARFDLFEYLVARGSIDADDARQPYATVNGEHVRIGRGLVFGRYGAARVLKSVPAEGLVVHVLDQCVFPVFPRLYMVKSPPWPVGPQG